MVSVFRHGYPGAILACRIDSTMTYADGRLNRYGLRAAHCVLLSVGVLAGACGAAEAVPSGERVSYSREIRPLLAKSCYACHGPDAGQRQAGLRLDVREVAVRRAIVPGNAAKSRLVRRVTSDDPDEQMPPPDSKRPRIDAAGAARLRQWIDQGAAFEEHWAYVPPVRPPLPDVPQADGPPGAVDRFIAAAWQRQGFRPSPRSDPRTLIRRVSFDLTGLPPAASEVDAFVADHSPAAYEKLVDRLLAAPQYGERMAMYWLDVARYADTCGYHSDNERSVWMYRDYVVRAFNGNKPFDRFTIEQLAGDLVAGASEEQKIASGYNRLLQTTEEGGAQAKEYTAKFAADRVRNTAAAWLGSTLGCAQCHDHKFDPFKSKDFYSFAAFFADVKEAAVGRQEQTPMPSAEQAAGMRQLDAELAALQKTLDAPAAGIDAAQAEWERTSKAKPPQPAPPKPVLDALAIEPAKRTDPQRQALAAYYRTIAPQLAATRDKLAVAKRQRDELTAAIPTTLITIAAEPRVVRILPRGNWQNDSGEIVTPAVPAALGHLDIGGRRANRLDLARWLVARDNPLVARVLVNRLWKLFFGQGIVRTLDDFGLQGAAPTHPELLDWLAVECIESGWDVKRMVKLLVMSRTYQQTSQGNAELEKRDPANLWLARQGRFRLDAEMVRDNALATSGLLVLRIGGPSVKPYQPAGYWSFLNFPTRDYAADRGENQYRRGLYTFWQRTFLHPSLLAFDASSREECTVERPRSNTPLQALVLLNDPTYVEAARVLAGRVIREGGTAANDRLRLAFRLVLARAPTPEEAAVLTALYEKHARQYAANVEAAKKLLEVGQTRPPDGVPPAELAAWTSVTRAILNLHETITRD
jgi:hypothetical protein